MSAPEFYYCDGSIISRVDRAPTEDDTLRAAAQAALEALLVALGYELRTLPLPTSVLTEEDATGGAPVRRAQPLCRSAVAERRKTSPKLRIARVQAEGVTAGETALSWQDETEGACA